MEVKIDLCGLDSCHDEDEDDDERYLGAKHEPPMGGQLRAFMACRTTEDSLYLQQQIKENNLTSKQFSQKKEVDMDRQVQSGSDVTFKRIPPKRNQSDEQGKQHIKQHNLAVPNQVSSNQPKVCSEAKRL